MTMALLLDIAIAGLLLALASWAIAARETFSAIIAFVVYGLLLGLVWVRLASIDIALTEAAIGSGVTGMLLLGAATRLRESDSVPVPTSFAVRLVTGVLCVAVSAGLAFVVLWPPDEVHSLAPMAMANLAESGLGNPVAGVLFVYRSLDTLLEKVVLLLALIGVWSLAPDRLWGGVPGLQRHVEPNSILVFLAQVLPPVGVLVGIYMFWVGAVRPGGAFQGGTVLAAMWLLVMIAGLRDVPAIARRDVRLLMAAGPVLFLVIGLAGFVVADAFLAYPSGYAKPLIVLIEAALTLSIGVTLGLLAAGPPARKDQP